MDRPINKSKFKDKHTFYDIGTMCGYYSLLLSKFFKKVYSFDIIEKCINETKFQLEINKAQKKLSNKNFLDKAPEKIVTQEKERMAFFSEKLQKLKQQITFFD